MEVTTDIKGMRICFIAGTLGMGGAEKQLYYIIRALKELGAEVHLISNYAGEYWEKPIKELGIKYYSLEKCSSFWQRLWQTIKITRKIKPHIVQAHHFYTSLNAAIAAKLCGAISIGAARGGLKTEISLTGKAGKYCFSWPNYFIVNSMDSLNEGVEMGRAKDRIFYLPNAIEPEKFLLIDRKAVNGKRLPIKLITLGRVVWEKRFERYLNLVARLKEKYGAGNVSAFLVGEGIEEEKLKAQAATLGLSDEDMNFTGKTSTPEKYMADSDIFILTSDSEGTPNVILEAMAAGIPIVSTKVGNVPFFMENDVHGYLVDKSDENELFNKVEVLIENPGLRDTMGENGRKMILDKFTVSALSKNIINLYTQINTQGK